MPANRSLSELTRKDLYDLIWSHPATKLAEEFGVSDVAVAKRCRKLNIPRPPRGYWAKIAARQKPQKTPLPPTPEAVKRPVGEALSLPENIEELHPLAAELLRALNAAKPDAEKRVTVCKRELPATIVTKALAERASKVFHVILQGVEPLGINFRKLIGPYGAGCFHKGIDRLYVKIEEKLIETGGLSNNHTIWQYLRTPSGYLTLIFTTDRYSGSETREWVERKRVPLEKLVARIVKYIRRHYIRVQRRRAKEAIEQRKESIESAKRHQEWLEKEAIRLAEAQKREHVEALKAVIKRRKRNLLRAAEWWRLHEVTQEFIAACEKRWRKEQDEQLNPEQEAWLTWARETSSALSPFCEGYPEPANDGPFDPAVVEFGGPYPQRRKIPLPPTMPVVPPPVMNASSRHFP